MPLLETTRQTDGGVIIENILHDSSNVLKTSYNYSTLQLYVTFQKGDVYNYTPVPHHVYEGLKTASSVGKFINAEIKPKHTCVKVGSAKPEIITEMVNKITKYKSDAKN